MSSLVALPEWARSPRWGFQKWAPGLSWSRGTSPAGTLPLLGFAGRDSVHFADLLRLAEMKRVAAEIADREPRIDVLVNNAGALFAKRQLTEDGLERTFALNHMAYFVMTAGLRERLLASGPARIINTASAAHLGATLDFDDLQSAKSSGARKAYGHSKLRNISSRVNSLAACKVRVSLPIACIPVSSPHALATKAVV